MNTARLPLAVLALSLAGFNAPAVAPVSAAAFQVEAAKPNVVPFPPQLAKFVRFVIHESSGGEPGLDELEIYGADERGNLALGSGGAVATASSCLPGHAIHQVAHLNDGRHGNSHSWIAAGTGPEWGQMVPGTEELCATLISHGGDLNGPIGLITPRQGRFNPAAVTNITQDSKPHYNMNWARQQCFRDPVPIARDYFLVSHAPLKHFGLYVIDRWGNREVLHFDPAISSMSPSPLRPLAVPPVLASLRPQDAITDEGEFFVQDIYAGLSPAVQRGSIRHLRVCQEVRADLEQLPGGDYRQDHPPFQSFYASPTDLVRGPNGWPTYVAKAALGLVPVEADGSVRFHAPARKVLCFQALDENLNEVQRMRSVVQLQPGERRSCIGCHEQRATANPVRVALAMRQPPRRIESPSWGAAPFDYAKVVQPVWDARCVRCHDRRDARKLDLTGTLDANRVPASYRTLITQGWAHYFDMAWSLPHRKAEPLTFGTVKSRLWPVLDRGHHGVTLTRDQMHRVKCWIDLNCPLWPDYLQRELRPGPAKETESNP